METKPFSQDLHDANDPEARDVVIKALERRGIEAHENPDIYGIDLLSDFRSYEVEVKKAWSGTEFPFQTVHISARKLKFAEPGNRFVMLNAEMTHALVFKGEDVRDARVITKSTIYTENEKFIELPIERAVRVKL